MSNFQLSEGAIHAFETNNSAQFPTPILQIVTQIKEIPSNNNSAQKQTRYRCVVSDGSGIINVFFATQLNPLIESSQIDRFSVLKINQYQNQNQKPSNFNAPSNMNNQQQPVQQLPKNDYASVQKQKPPQAQFNNPPPKYNSGGGFTNVSSAPVHSGPAPTIFQIKNVNPYQNKWTIKARLTQKSDIKTWSNQRGTGRLFNANFIDESGEIRVTGFNDQVDQFYAMLEVGKVYYLSSARVNLANSKFNKTKNEYDAKDDFVDVLGVVTEVSDLTEIRTKATNKVLSKRDLTIADDSMYSIRLTLWGADAENFGYSDNPVIAFQSVKVGDYGGRTLSMMFNSSMLANPDIPEAFRLRSWYDSTGKSASFNSFASMAPSGTTSQVETAVKNIDEIKEEALGMGDKPDYYTLNATVVYIRNENMTYPACPSENCNKKVIQEDGQWRCENCQRTYPNPDYRYIFSVNVSDHTGNMWVQCFNDTGKEIVGISANELMDFFENDKEKFDSILLKANFNKFQFRCRAKNETYNDNTRVKHVAVSAHPINFVTESKKLYNLIDGFKKISVQ
ncbi:hypothetical protein BB560_002781 [Smittium megazygosporum]|uniref:Replication protein A subunit n=1 Tax=Smittium megazygosporum TaxID=133381 RepID=A0A2T9ZDV0_9FUNG|nr:hypothetical protein BB560_002781 [Smittium megazygosporum]